MSEYQTPYDPDKHSSPEKEAIASQANEALASGSTLQKYAQTQADKDYWENVRKEELAIIEKREQAEKAEREKRLQEQADRAAREAQKKQREEIKKSKLEYSQNCTKLGELNRADDADKRRLKLLRDANARLAEVSFSISELEILLNQGVKLDELPAMRGLRPILTDLLNR